MPPLLPKEYIELFFLHQIDQRLRKTPGNTMRLMLHKKVSFSLSIAELPFSFAHPPADQLASGILRGILDAA